MAHVYHGNSAALRKVITGLHMRDTFALPRSFRSEGLPGNHGARHTHPRTRLRSHRSRP